MSLTFSIKKLIDENPYIKNLIEIGGCKYADYLNDYYFSDNYDADEYYLMQKAETDVNKLVSKFDLKLKQKIINKFYQHPEYENKNLYEIRKLNKIQYEFIINSFKSCIDLKNSRNLLMYIDKNLKYLI